MKQLVEKHQYNVRLLFFQFSFIEVLPSLNEIASTGIDLNLYCNVLRPNCPKKMTQDIKFDDFIFENSLLYWLYRWDYSFDNAIAKEMRMSTLIMQLQKGN